MNSAGGGQSGLDKRSSGFLLIVSEFHGLLVRLAFLVTHLPSLLLLEMSGDSNVLARPPMFMLHNCSIIDEPICSNSLDGHLHVMVPVICTIF